MAKTKQTGQQVILIHGLSQSIFSVPDDGVLLRLRVNGRNLIASFEEGGQSGALNLISQAIGKLRVDEIVDHDHPFRPYSPGVICGN
jgi:hypothetical protein